MYIVQVRYKHVLVQVRYKHGTLYIVQVRYNTVHCTSQIQTRLVHCTMYRSGTNMCLYTGTGEIQTCACTAQSRQSKPSLSVLF